MAHLDDILRNAVELNEVVIEAGALRLISEMSGAIATQMELSGNRLHSYLDYVRGVTSGFTSGSQDKSSPYHKRGYLDGRKQRGTFVEEVKQVANRDQSVTQASYERLNDQIRQALQLLEQEITLMMESQTDGYKFLQQQIKLHDRGHKHISDGLIAVLSRYQDWTNQILNQQVTQTIIDELERSDGFEPNMRLGVYYLFEDGPQRAQRKFVNAVYADDRPDDATFMKSFRHVHASIYPAQKMLRKGYERIKLVRQFGQIELVGV